MTGGMPNRHALLLDRLEVAEFVASTLLLAELREWIRFADRYADTMILDYSPEIGAGPLSFSRDGFVSFFRVMMESFDRTTHQVTNQLVDLNGNSARCRSLIRAAHQIHDDLYITSGVYTHELTRTVEGDWKIHLQKATTLFWEGNPAVIAYFAERAKVRMPDLPIA